MKLSTYKKQRKHIDKLRKEKDQLEGSLKRELRILEDQFSCSSIEEAEKLLEQRKEEHKKLTAELKHLIEEYQSWVGWRKKDGE